jgi:hypothetical protein
MVTVATNTTNNIEEGSRREGKRGKGGERESKTYESKGVPLTLGNR